jgi:hypothetical protein
MNAEYERRKEDFMWWFSAAKEYYKDAAFNKFRKSNYNSQYLLQHAVEFTLKAAIRTFADRHIITKNNVTLLRTCRRFIPDLYLLFPLDSTKDRRLFYFLKPSFELQRGSPELIAGTDDLVILFDRVKALQNIVESVCLERIEKFKP